MIKIVQNKNLKDYCSFKIGGEAFEILEITNEDDVLKAHQLSKSERKPLIIIGDGTNTIFNEGKVDLIIGLMKITGIRIIQDFDKSSIVEFGAGENWNEIVEWSLDHKYSGIELLAGIPGTAGAAPVQNIGAYGKELSDCFVNAYVFDKKEEKFKILGLKECEFEYRDSIFKKEQDRYIILKISLELKKTPADEPTYKDLKLYFLGQNKPSAKQIRNAVWEIRSEKLPDPWDHPNCGSFFKNPYVDVALVQTLLDKYPTLPHFQINEDTFKLYAGWLIENTELDKIKTKNITFNPKNKLVLINNGQATYKELINLVHDIKKAVSSHFGIELEVEPRIFE